MTAPVDPEPTPVEPAPTPSTPGTGGGVVVVTPPTSGGGSTATDIVQIADSTITSQLADANANAVEVKLPELSATQKKVAASLTTSSLSALKDAKKPLVVVTNGTTVEIPATVLQSIAETKASSLIIAIELTEDTVNAANVSNIYKLTLTSIVDGKEVAVSDFNEKVTVTLPLSGKVKDADKVAAFYVNEDGTLSYVQSKVVGDTVVFKTNHFSKFVVIENDITFQDLSNFSWARQYIDSLASKTIIKGKTEDTFAPGDNITRAQFAVLLARALDLPLAKYEGLFTDVLATQSSSALEIEAASRAGIISGSDGKFRPTENITREQMATMIIRALNYSNPEALKDVSTELAFADASTIQSWAKDSVGQVAALGFISGKTLDGKQVYAPKDFATRAQAAKMLYTLLEKL